MQVTKKDLEKSQIELTVELTLAEFEPYIVKGAEEVAKNVKIEGFRPGKAPLEVLKQKIGEMTILEEAAHLAIHKTLDEVIEKNTMERQAFGQPNVSITKLAPNNPLEYKITLSLLPTVALGDYKDLKIKEEEVKMDEKELAKSLKELQEMRAVEVLSEEPIKKGDKAVVDIKMFLDKVPVEGGQHNDLAVLVGKEYFVPGFDDHLIGAKKDEERKFNLPYPDDHHQKNLAGKLVEFEVKVKDAYTRAIPELNDQFAGFFQVKNLEELKKTITDSLLAEKKRNADLKSESEMVEKIINNAKFGDFPDALIESETNNILGELEQSVIRQGGKFEDYLSHLKKTRAQLMLDLAPNAVKRVKAALAIREIAIIEKINVTEKEIHEKIDELKKQYAQNQDILKMIVEPGYHGYLSNVLTNEKVITQLKDWNYVRTGHQQKS